MRFSLLTRAAYTSLCEYREKYIAREMAEMKQFQTSVLYIFPCISKIQRMTKQECCLMFLLSFQIDILILIDLTFPATTKYHKFPGNILEILFDLQHNTPTTVDVCITSYAYKTTPARFS